MAVRWWSETIVTAAQFGQNARLCSFSAVRVFLGVSAIGSNTQCFVSTRPNVSSTTGSPLTSGSTQFPQMQLTVANNPMLVIQEWWLNSPAFPPSNAAVVFEEFYDPGASVTLPVTGLVLPNPRNPDVIVAMPDEAHELLLQLRAARMKLRV